MSYEEQDVIWRVALASYDPREMRVWTRYLEERNPAIRCTGYRSSRPLLERLEQGDVDVLVLGGRLEDMDSIQFLPRIRGLARKPLVLLRDDGRNEKSAVESLSQEDACYLIRQATLEDMLQELRAPAHRPAESLEKRCERICRRAGWKLTLTARPGGGTRAQVVFPLASCEDIPPEMELHSDEENDIRAARFASRAAQEILLLRRY